MQHVVALWIEMQLLLEKASFVNPCKKITSFGGHMFDHPVGSTALNAWLVLGNGTQTTGVWMLCVACNIWV